jgi:hypothetical protein
MCSINPTGVVFETSRPLDISSELALTIQTDLLGLSREWSVQGWVIDCTPVNSEFQVTLLFSEVPQGLQQLLALTGGYTGTRAYPPVDGAEIFGLN